jgi:hypothetical protein
MSIFREDVVHKANPMSRWEFINPLTSLFWPHSTMLSSWISTHQLSLVFQSLTTLLVFELGIHKPTLIFILATTTLCEELGTNKPALILHLSFFLRCALSSASMLGIYTPTPLVVFKFSQFCPNSQIVFELPTRLYSPKTVCVFYSYTHTHVAFEISRLFSSSLSYMALGLEY